RHHDDMRADPVVALRNLATGATWLLPDRSPLVVGAAPSCDVVIAGRTVALRHATLERTVGGWHLRDTSSTNATYLGGHRASPFPIAASSVFQLGETLLVALSPMMLAALSAVEVHLGLDQPHAVSRFLVAAHRDEPVVIAGPPGSGHVELALAIHA